MSKRLYTCLIMLTVGIMLMAGCLPLTQFMQYNLFVSVNGEGYVSPMNGMYMSGTPVTLTATPKANWKFDHWEGDAVGNQATVTVIMNSNKTVIAYFIPNQYAVNATVQGQGIVEQTLLANPQATYNPGATVQLKAVPAEGWKFKEWQGDVTGTTNPTTITVTKEYNVKAVFELLPVLPKWNFLVYLDGDNNLEQAAIYDINEMEEIGSTQDLNIFVLVDRNPQYDTSNGNWTGTRLYRITRDVNNSADIVSELIHDYGELDMANPQNLQDFLLKIHQTYPAERTILTLWDHGDGLYPKSINRSGSVDTKDGFESPGTVVQKGICWDDTTGTDPWSCLTTDEIATALKNVRQVTGKKIEILNMDACLMQTLEVAYEWRTEVNYLVGSQETVPGEGNNYETLLGTLKSNPAIGTAEFAKTLVDDYYNYYSTAGEGKETYSALSLGVEFDNLIVAFKAFATALYQTTDLDAVYRAWNNTTFFSFYQYDDLYDLSKELITESQDTNVVTKATALQQAMSSAIINHKETTQYQGKAFGLSIFLPSAKEWPNYSEANQYVSYLLSNDTDWDNFVLRFVEYTGSTTPDSPLVAQLSWPSGDCDLGVYEPDQLDYWINDGPSPNGVFSEDMTNGGTESWYLNATHAAGVYVPIVYSNNYTGDVTLSVAYNGESYPATFPVEPGYIYYAYQFEVTSVQGVQQLNYKVERLPLHKSNK